MKMRLSAATLLLASTPAHAALSGFYDSAEQIKTIIESAEVADALRQLPIESLEREGVRGDGAIRWEIEAEGCDLTVHLRPALPAGVGMTTYDIEVGRTCQR